jgi:hypothetical protein
MNTVIPAQAGTTLVLLASCNAPSSGAPACAGATSFVGYKVPEADRLLNQKSTATPLRTQSP